MQKIAIIIPCYKEANRLQENKFIDFLQLHPDVHLFLVNDGSPDNTGALLERMQLKASNQITVLQLPTNKGKANAVQQGVLLAAARNTFVHIGYLDADLSTELAEFYRLSELITQHSIDFAIGSRIRMMNTYIERSTFRHVAGRFVSTIVDSRFRLGIYDTQCGAKCFKADLIAAICEKTFTTKWLFDVEILLRIKKNFPSSKGIEAPLHAWKDVGGSSVRILHFPGIMRDIGRLTSIYKRK